MTLGKKFAVTSKVLNQTREIQVYLPKRYKDSIKKNYPVIYVLDSQDYFNSVVSFQEMLIKRGIFPEFIMVGIKTDIVKRRILFDEHKGATSFISFLEHELIPFIDSSYRTNKEKERIFFGWEMAGGIGVEIIAKKPNLFSGYIIASATNVRGTRVNSLERYLKEFKKHEAPFLLMTAAPDESWLNKNEKLRSFFDKNKYDDLNWRYSIFNREQHHTTPFRAINEGIIDYFFNYNPVTFRTLKEYEDFGGLDGLTSFYKKRAERFGVSATIDDSTKMFILYNAVVENNYERFVYYENAFEGHLESNSGANWFHRYGSFYLKHRNLKDALYVYNYGLKKLGDSKLLYRGLGDVYSKMNKKNKAKKAYKKALKIDPEYKQALEGLNKI
ncbi:alpha/beta hydrolase [Tenacibaculum retecalamus]|uniref:alpha/beta hydrolase n=1 Tax=Tenacibaculum retecalamus TaxID=3018315 RepID=UPI0023D93DFC|nr:alpha/beta hydrolase-fold protein [Tenacibaculum retecalamus]WBX72476.1 alpha/beta hydrolase-fold protein [Tenacibaculum retecalamus]